MSSPPSTPVPDAPSPSDARAFLTRFLSGRDHPCPSCGYSLRGLTSDRCPECNQPLKLNIALREPKLAAYLCGLVGWSAGGGFCIMLIVWMGLMFLRRGFSGIPGSALTIAVVGSLIGCAGLVGWLRARRLMSRLDNRLRWLLALGAWPAAMACPFFFILTVD